MQIKTRCRASTAINSNLFILIKVLSNNGGATRDRTADLLNAIQALSQLSYSPIEEILYIISDLTFSLIDNEKQNILCRYLMQRKPHRTKRRFSIY